MATSYERRFSFPSLLNFDSDACYSDDEGEDIIEDNSENQIILIPRGTFFNESFLEDVVGHTDTVIGVHPLEIRYGFVKRHDIQGSWNEENVIKMNYSHGINEEVVVNIPPECKMDHHLAYQLYFAPRSCRGERFQTETRFVNLENYNPLEEVPPKWVRLPIANFAAHPFRDAQYSIRVYNFATETDQLKGPSSSTMPTNNCVIFPGKIKYIFYGFTEASEEEYFKSRTEVPWRNAFGDFVAEGVIDISRMQHHHNGETGAKGMFMMHEIWVRLPNATTNLVWKIGFDKWDGNKPWEPSNYQGYHETQTFYYKTAMRSRRPSQQGLFSSSFVLSRSNDK